MPPTKVHDAATPALPEVPNPISLTRAVIAWLAAFRAELDMLRDQVRTDASRPPRVRRLMSCDD